MKPAIRAMVVLAAALAAMPSPSRADWPEWRGPSCSGAASSGCELVDSLDKARLAWKSEPVGLSGCGHGSPDHLATGFCDPVIAGGRVYLFWFERSGEGRVEWERIAHSRSFGMRLIREAYRDPNEVDGQSRYNADDVILCLDAATGRPLWKRVFRERGFNHRKVYSPLCVPAVSGGRLYALGSAGSVYCLDAVTGKSVWRSDVGKAAEQFEQMRELCARTGVRGFEPMAFNHAVSVIDGVVVVGDSGSPLGGRGGDARERDAGMVGLDAATGRRLWQVPHCLHRWGMPGRWRHQGREYAVAACGTRMVALAPPTGKVLWELAGPVSDSVTLAISGDYVVVNTNKTKDPKGDGPTCYRLGLEGATKLWSLPPAGSLFICHVGAAILGEHAYVLTSDGLQCVELAGGKVLGAIRPFGHAYSGYAGGDGMLWDPKLKAVGAWPNFRPLDGQLPDAPTTGFIHSPAYADGRVYLRGRTNIYCYDFRKNAAAATPGGAPPATMPAAADAPEPIPPVPQLIALLNRGDYASVMRACDALETLKSDAAPAVPALAALLKADQPALAVAKTLCAIGPKAAQAVPTLLALAKGDNEELAYHALKAVMHVGPPKDLMGELIDLVVKHPWMGDKVDGAVLPGYSSYVACLLSLGGPDAVGLLLAKAQANFDKSAKMRGLPSGDLIGDYMAGANMITAACMADPKAKADVRKMVEAVMEANKGKNLATAGQRLRLIQMDLAGTIDLKDPWGVAKVRADSEAKKAAEQQELKAKAPKTPGGDEE
jgi:outer membrane protein assembly factor BamB